MTKQISISGSREPMKNLTHEEFLNSIPKRVFDNITILGVYKNQRTKILVGDKYGEMLVSPTSLISNSIPNIQSAVDKSLYFINKAMESHGEKYDYSLVEYKSDSEKIKIICEHGHIFEQSPRNHINNPFCKECYRIEHAKTPSDKSVISYTEKIYKINTIFDYSEVKILNRINYSRVFTLDKYGVCISNIYQLLQGKPPTIESAVNKTKYFINMAIEVHGEIYDYSLSNYIKNNIKIKIVCPLHGEFEQVPSSHLLGIGCQKCGDNKKLGKYSINNAEKYKGKWININAKLYFIRVFNENESFYKIGITNRSRFHDRFNSARLPYKYEILFLHDDNLYNCCHLENKLHNHFSDKSYIPNIKFGGYTECFKDIELKEVENIVQAHIQ